MSALLLIAHGASDRPLDDHPIWAHAAALRAMGHDRVEVGFLRGEPTIQHARAALAAEGTPAIVVPCFMARGYFVEQVLPGALGDPALTIGQTSADGLLTLAPPAGEQPILAAIALSAVRDALAAQDDAHQWRVVLVGHGTARHPRSAATVEAAAALIRDTLGVIVQVGFLDQEPTIEAIMATGATKDAPTLVLPWLAGGGGHAEHDIPTRAITPAPFLHLAPIGAHPAMAQAIADAAHPHDPTTASAHL
jgi:sirohydrochlorin ferrochelatase